MNEENNCIEENGKFTLLECLIAEYYGLVKEHQDGLPPYATFKTYLVDGDDSIDRPKKVKDLIKNLNKNTDEDKLKAISKLWVQGKIEIDGTTYEGSSPRLIHSANQKGKLQSAVKTIDSDSLLKISKLIHKYITKEQKEIDLQNKIFFTEENMEFFNNRFNAVLNEMLFWFYYRKDTYPIVNKRAKKSKEILEWAFDKDFGDDLNFNNTCMNIKDFNSIEGENFKITKQLMLDQLFYSIDEMKSIEEINKVYSEDKKNKIYKFYKKLWNTIKEAKRIDMHKDLNLFKNIIYHGAPGTGKTHDMKKEIKEHLDLYEAGTSEFIQFHGSYYYEDFIGGLKPNTKSENGLSLEFRNGIFKELCREAAKYEVAYYAHKGWDGKYLDENTTLSNEITLKVNEKEYKLKTKEPVLSQFPPYFILIDEINRADLSKVFGELLFAIEDNYRGFENRFKLSTSQMEDEDTAVYWDEEEEGKKARFFVPKNLYIRGTMNDIDKSIDSIDFAFRRRFKWVEKEFEKDKIKDIIKERGYEHIDSSSLDEYSQKCESLNKKIAKDISIADETYKIGHAIFADIVKYIGNKSKISKDSKGQLFNNHIEPIIYNYLKMDYGNESNDINAFKKVFVD